MTLTVVATTPRGLDEVDALLGPQQWQDTAGPASATNLSFSFPAVSQYSWWLAGYDGAESEFVGYSALANSARTIVRAAAAEIESFANIDFTELAEGAHSLGDIRVTATGVAGLDPEGPWAGWAYFPDTSPMDGDVWISQTLPTLGFAEVLRHEIGHALGLKHPFTGTPTLSSGQDRKDYTLMSYTWPTDRSFTDTMSYMVLDVEALQHLYGANMTTRTGNTVYAVTTYADSWRTLWDAGGTDLIQCAGSSDGWSIDLREGHAVQPDADADRNILAWIANGAVIENANGGNRADLITGNDVANRLVGNAGNDTLVGGAGNDTLIGGAGNDEYAITEPGDVVVENGGGIDTLGTSMSWTIPAAIEILRLDVAGITGTGDGRANIIVSVLGGATMIGGAGNDTYRVDFATDTITEVAAGGRDTVEASVSYTLAQGSSIENLTLTGTLAIDATGNELANVLTGNGQANVLDGGDGIDTLRGGSGDDTYVVAGTAGTSNALAPRDRVVEFDGDGEDTLEVRGTGLSFAANVNVTLPANVETLRLYDGTAAADADLARWNGYGNAGDNTLLGNGAANRLDGAAGSDVMFGNGGNDTLSGGGDDDSLDGGAGNDALVGGAGSDTLTGNAGNDTLIGGAGDDVYEITEPGDVFSETGGGIDTLGTTMSYTIPAAFEILRLDVAGITGTGDGRANIIVSMLGGATMIGGAGNDTYRVGFANDTITEAASRGRDTVESSVAYTLAQGSNIEDLTLTGSAEIAGSGNELANVLTGNDAANVLYGGAGIDTLRGGGGNDTFILDGEAGTSNARAPRDLVTERTNAGTDTIEVHGAALSFTANVRIALPAHVENLRLYDRSAAADADLARWNGVGNALDNELAGNGAANRLDAGAGADTVYGNAGNDTLIGGAGNDTLLGGDGNDSLDGGAGDDLMEGGDGNDRLVGGAGNDALYGNGGNDTLIGGAGNDIYVITEPGDVVVESGGGIDTLGTSMSYTIPATIEILRLDVAGITGTGDGRANIIVSMLGSATMVGGAGNDTYRVDFATDTITENATGGRDTVEASVSYTLAQGSRIENLTLTGIDAIDGSGNELANVITGNDEANRLYGGAGIDTLRGSGGNDTYILDGEAGTGNAHAPRDRVEETGDGGDDTIEVHGAGLTFTASVAINLAANVDNLRLFDGTAPADNDLARWDGLGNGLDNEIEGNGAANRLDGDDGNDTITGHGGNDTLIGGSGSDELIGGDGDDLFILADADDEVTEDAGAGTDTVRIAYAASGAFAEVIYLADNVENLEFTRQRTGNVVGNGSDNLITGTNLANTIAGGDGDDRLLGRGGNDVLLGNDGADTLEGGTGNDLYVAGFGDTVSETGGAGTDTLNLGGSSFVNNFADLMFARTADGHGLSIAYADSGSPSAERLTVAGMDNLATMVEILRVFDADGRMAGEAINLRTAFAAATATPATLTLQAQAVGGLLVVATP